MANGGDWDQYIPLSFQFSVTIDGETLSFSEASGLHSEMVVEELRVGGRNDRVYSLPVRVKNTNLVLKRAFNTNIKPSNKVERNKPLYTDWINKVLYEDGNLNVRLELKNIVVKLLDPKGNELMSWEIEGAYPVKWSISNLNATENNVAVETIEFAYQSVRLKVD
ncbi:MAG TPA: phage tail protein [Saprospiraceae bacterium]|jgi:phage tail-like protein|nr:MAG: glycerol acyltransferase [Candidatus Parvibacillus calidus]MBX2938232.1 phage tail protein [Saprospiraceae bacterium]MBK7740732.1 phage tail protein [Candidatus Parvibacillus calidus]MBX7178913.1 phage tail protein [Saprospiraceae bacterium]MCB0591083.1 phage tail protein [Saprospiraceae bacterium]